MAKKRKAKLTPKLKENLLEAIARARHPGSFHYQCDGKPCCVIGQLAAIEGLTVATLQKWDAAHQFKDGEHTSDTVDAIVFNKVYGSKSLTKYPLDLLDKLQRIWDLRSGDETELKIALTDTVEEYWNESTDS